MARNTDLPQKGDFAMAYKAIGVSPLTSDAKVVGIAIVSHFNSKTGQCDPGTERLMARAKVSRRTVVNATNELHQRGLIFKDRHGGNGFRSSYQPNWALFRKVSADFDNGENDPEIVQEPALTQCKNVHIDSANPCTLTHIRNSHKKLTHTVRASGGVSPDKPQQANSVERADKIEGLLKGSVRRISVAKVAPPSVASARGSAKDQLDQAIEGLSDTVRSFVLERITPEITDEAITEEQKSRGAGIRLVIDRVSQAGSSGRSRRPEGGSKVANPFGA